MKATRIGNVWFTEDGEYGIRGPESPRNTCGGWEIFRGDGARVFFAYETEEEAAENAEKLANGELSDEDFDWTDDE